MMNFGQEFADEDIEEMVNRFDEDKDGYLEFHEFVKLLSNI